MKFSKSGLSVLTAAMLISLAACNDAGEVGDGNVSALSDTDGTPAQQDSPLLDADVIPEEYTRENSGLTRLALARLQPTEGHTTSGLISFIETDSDAGIRVVAKVINATEGEHGFHVHENGDCSAPDASSAGSHFNPGAAAHAGRTADSRHTGDLGNITADNVGTADLDISDEKLSFTGMNSILGKAVVVHNGRDDLSSQPSGNSGEPVACGVIELLDTAEITRY